MSTSKLVFDMDGTIADGKYIDQSKLASSPADQYATLEPYDSYTATIWNQLCDKYDIFICTWRSYPGASRDIATWLASYSMHQPAGIICGEATNIPGTATSWKIEILKALNPEGFFDDHPGICKLAKQEWSWPLTYKMYNRQFDGDTPSIEMISSWKQIGALFL